MSEPIHIAIAEDEASCARDLISQLHRFEQENSVRFQITQYTNALDLLEEYRAVYDLLLLDIEMPLLDGLSAARKIHDMDDRVLIMFITRIAKYAVQSYDVQAVDYVLKPLKYPVFSMKLQRILRRIRGKNERFVLVQGQGVLRRISVGDVYYVEVADHMLTWHTANGDFTVKGTMRSAAQELEGCAFARCNNCYLVNLAHFQELREDTAYVGGDALKVSRSRRKEFLEAILRYQRGELV